MAKDFPTKSKKKYKTRFGCRELGINPRRSPDRRLQTESQEKIILTQKKYI